MVVQFAQLKEALTALSESGRTVDVFFRDDDAVSDDALLRQLLELFQRRHLPLVVGVIPALLTEAGRDLLLRQPDFIEIVQHGWRHQNHEPQGRKCEFGLSRSFEQQLADIAEGQARMNEAFGHRWFPAFIPPWNRSAEATLQALKQCGFKALSQLSKRDAQVTDELPELSVTLDIFRWKGGAQLRETEDLLSEFLQQTQQPGPSGILLHHEVMTPEAFAFLENLLDVLQSAGCVRFHTLQSLIQTSW
jgi:peptidoglycan/xylan/chitin deacetylase (PgdA/CDA1 family)